MLEEMRDFIAFRINFCKNRFFKEPQMIAQRARRAYTDSLFVLLCRESDRRASCEKAAMPHAPCPISSL
jgi:hypothetical protein